MGVLKLCDAQGVQACNLGVPILTEELERFQQAKKMRSDGNQQGQGFRLGLMDQVRHLGERQWQMISSTA